MPVHAGVLRPRGDLAGDHLIAYDELLSTPKTPRPPRASVGVPAVVRARVPDDQQRDLGLELDEAFDNHPPGADATTILRIGPCPITTVGFTGNRLTLPARAHHRPDHAWNPGRSHCIKQRAKRLGAGHLGRPAPMGDLHCGRAGVPINPGLRVPVSRPRYRCFA